MSSGKATMHNKRKQILASKVRGEISSSDQGPVFFTVIPPNKSQGSEHRKRSRCGSWRKHNRSAGLDTNPSNATPATRQERIHRRLLKRVNIAISRDCQVPIEVNS